MAKKKELTRPLPVRRSPAEQKLIKKLASDAQLSESRLMVTAALLLSEFKTPEEMRAALHVGGLLWQARAQAVMQVRRLGHQLERLRVEVEQAAGGAGLAGLDEVLSEVSSTLKQLGATWRGRSRK